jgi:DNA polymerase V
MADIKAYTPTTNSLGAGQVLHCPYDARGARLITLEMADQLSLDLFSKGLMTDSLTLTLNYDSENISGGSGEKRYLGEVGRDFYGRAVPKHAHGTKRLGKFTSSTTELMQAAGALFDEIVNTSLLIRRIGVTFCHVISSEDAKASAQVVQLDFFSEEASEPSCAEREEKKQQAILDIKRKFGKNAIMRGLNLEEGATARDRNEQIGGHKA